MVIPQLVCLVELFSFVYMCVFFGELWSLTRCVFLSELDGDMVCFPLTASVLITLIYRPTTNIQNKNKEK